MTEYSSSTRQNKNNRRWKVLVGLLAIICALLLLISHNTSTPLTGNEGVLDHPDCNPVARCGDHQANTTPDERRHEEGHDDACAEQIHGEGPTELGDECSPIASSSPTVESVELAKAWPWVTTTTMTDMVYHPHIDRLACVTSRGDILVWNPRIGELESTVIGTGLRKARKLVAPLESADVLVLSGHSTLDYVNLRTGRVTRFPGDVESPFRITALALCSPGDDVLIGFQSGRITRFESDGTQVWDQPSAGIGNPETIVQWDAGSDFMVGGVGYNSAPGIAVIDLETGNVKGAREFHGFTPQSLQALPGTTFCLFGVDTSLSLWDTAEGVFSQTAVVDLTHTIKYSCIAGNSYLYIAADWSVHSVEIDTLNAESHGVLPPHSSCLTSYGDGDVCAYLEGLEARSIGRIDSDGIRSAPYVSAAHISADCQSVVLGTSDGMIVVQRLRGNVDRTSIALPYRDAVTSIREIEAGDVYCVSQGKQVHVVSVNLREITRSYKMGGSITAMSYGSGTIYVGLDNGGLYSLSYPELESNPLAELGWDGVRELQLHEQSQRLYILSLTNYTLAYLDLAGDLEKIDINLKGLVNADAPKAMSYNVGSDEVIYLTNENVLRKYECGSDTDDVLWDLKKDHPEKLAWIAGGSDATLLVDPGSKQILLLSPNSRSLYATDFGSAPLSIETGHFGLPLRAAFVPSPSGEMLLVESNGRVYRMSVTSAEK